MHQTAAMIQPMSCVSDTKTLLNVYQNDSDTLRILIALTAFDLLFFLILSAVCFPDNSSV